MGDVFLLLNKENCRVQIKKVKLQLKRANLQIKKSKLQLKKSKLQLKLSKLQIRPRIIHKFERNPEESRGLNVKWIEK